LSSRSSNSRKAACKNSAPFWRTCSSRALKLRQSEGTVKIALSFCTSSAYMGDLTSFLALVLCVRSPFFRVKWLILPGQPVTPRKRYSIAVRRAGGARSVVQLFDAGTQIQLVDEGQILLGRQLPAAARHGDEQRLDDVGGEGAAVQLGRGGDQEAHAAPLQLVHVLLRNGLGDDGFAREIVGHVAADKMEVAGDD